MKEVFSNPFLFMLSIFAFLSIIRASFGRSNRLIYFVMLSCPLLMAGFIFFSEGYSMESFLPDGLAFYFTEFSPDVKMLGYALCFALFIGLFSLNPMAIKYPSNKHSRRQILLFDLGYNTGVITILHYFGIIMLLVAESFISFLLFFEITSLSGLLLLYNSVSKNSHADILKNLPLQFYIYKIISSVLFTSGFILHELSFLTHDFAIDWASITSFFTSSDKERAHILIFMGFLINIAFPLFGGWYYSSMRVIRNFGNIIFAASLPMVFLFLLFRHFDLAKIADFMAVICFISALFYLVSACLQKIKKNSKLLNGKYATKSKYINIYFFVFTLLTACSFASYNLRQEVHLSYLKPEILLTCFIVLTSILAFILFGWLNLHNARSNDANLSDTGVNNDVEINFETDNDKNVKPINNIGIIAICLQWSIVTCYVAISWLCFGFGILLKILWRSIILEFGKSIIGNKDGVFNKMSISFSIATASVIMLIIFFMSNFFIDVF